MSEYLYLVERDDGKQLSVHKSKHEAVGFIAQLGQGERDWYDIVPISPLCLLYWTPRVKTGEWGPHPGYPATPDDYNPCEAHP